MVISTSPRCAELAPLSGRRVILPAVVTAIAPVLRRDQTRTLTQVKLADATGQAHLLLDPAQEHRLNELHRHKTLLAEVCTQNHHWGIGGQLLDWWTLPPGYNAARLLPLPECPTAARGSLERLITLIEGFQVPAITKAFNALILKAGPGILDARASWHDHHAQPGGLLIHTVEVIEFALREAAWVFPNDPARQELIALMALTHDLAKSEMHRQGACDTFANGLGHQLSSVSFVSDAMRQLGQDEPRLGHLAGQILRWLSLSAQVRRIRQCPEGELVQRADEFSVIANITQRQPLFYQRQATPA